MMVISASQAPLDRLQEGLPRPLRGIPVQAMLAAAGLFASSAVVVGMVALRSDRVVLALEEEGPRSPSRGPDGAPAPQSSAAPAPAQRSAAELEAARAGGTEALAALAKRFPDDAEVLRALGLAQTREKKDLPGALKTLRRLLETRGAEPPVDREVQQAFVELANGPPEVAADALEILRTRMGSAGPDLVFDLVQGATGKYAKEHAAAALDDPGLMKAASRALVIADELRRKQACSRKASIAKAAAEGDARALQYLRPLVATRQCGGLVGLLRGPECPVFACLSPADRAAIAAAIAAIEKRDPAARAPSPTGSASAAPAPSQGGSMLR